MNYDYRTIVYGALVGVSIVMIIYALASMFCYAVFGKKETGVPKMDNPPPPPVKNIGGYQPIDKLTTDPPQGGSGVPDVNYPHNNTNEWGSKSQKNDNNGPIVMVDITGEPFKF